MKVYQIYFDKSQINELIPEYTPFFNTNTTVFFENEVIRTLIEQGAHHDTDYFGVVSYKLAGKLKTMKKDWSNFKDIVNYSEQTFTPKNFEAELYRIQPDVLSFQRHAAHDPISQANSFHPNFIPYWKEIMAKIGYSWKPEEFQNVFYCNYFVARSSVYEQYVREMLAPAMNVMLPMKDLFKNPKYPRLLPNELQKKWRIKHFPYHPFLCERMFSYFAHLHKLKCAHF